MTGLATSVAGLRASITPMESRGIGVLELFPNNSTTPDFPAQVISKGKQADTQQHPHYCIHLEFSIVQ
jgi:hypothetical protein